MVLKDLANTDLSIFFKDVLNAVLHPVCIKNKQHQWVWVNEAFCELIGLDQGYILEKTDKDFFREEEVAVVWQQDDLVFQIGEPTTHKEILTRTDGVEVLFETQRSIIQHGIMGKLLVVMMKDITQVIDYQQQIEDLVIEKNKDEQYAQELLNESEILFRSIFENAYEGINYTVRNEKTKNYMFHHINQKGLDIYEVSLEQYFDIYKKRENFLIHYAPEFQANGEKTILYYNKLAKRIAQNQKVEYEWLTRTSTGKLKHLYYTVFFVKISEDKTGVISIFKDITDQKEKEAIIKSQLKDLSNKNQELKRYIESNMQLENFAYMASHDLRSPLQTMIGFTNLLEQSLSGKLSEEEASFFEFINSSISNMQALIKDLLAYSIVDAEKQKPEEIQLHLLLKTIQSELGKVIKETQAIIEVQDIPKIISADKIKLKQLLQNLITNGIKFTQNDTQPKVAIACKELDAYWQFSIRDNGIGIAKEFQKKIFLIFRRLHPRDEYEGTGIGLALCKKLVEQHQGRIWLDSEPGKGSTFFFTIKKKLDENF